MCKTIVSLLLTGALLLSCGVSACAVSAADEVKITLSDSGVKVDGSTASTDPGDAVHTGGDIIYYRSGTDDSYGEGTADEMHDQAEAAAHTVVTISQPGTYRLTGKLSKGQIFVDLGEDAKRDSQAVVTLILDNADITCTVAPAVFFYRVYECDTDWVAYDEGESEAYTASAVVDTVKAGANVVLAAGSENNVSGSHVARIYREGTTKKLHKYDGAFYSRMSMNLFGDNGDDSGMLNIVADNEGLDSELHLSINGGTISIKAQDDGINTNEDGVSVTTINGGTLTINAGLGAEGDGIDSNGYLVINGGNVYTMSNESSPDGGIDADMPILINGGFLSAFGTRNDAVSTQSKQPYMELSFASTLPAGSVVKLTDSSGNTVWVGTTQKKCQSITLTTADLALDTIYYLYADGVQQQYTGNRSGMMGGPGGFGGGERPEGMTLPEGMEEQAPPESFVPGQDGTRPDRDGDFSQMGERPQGTQGQEPPEGFAPGQEDGAGTQREEGSVDFVLTDAVRTFSGVSDSPDGSGKTRVSFTVNGGKGMTSVASGQTPALSDIRASVSDLPDSDVQITVTDVPSEDYAETCLLSDGADALSALLPTADGTYRLTVAVVSANEIYAGVSQWQFTVGALPFTDVRENSTCYAAVKFVYDAGLMQGTSKSTFSPDAPVTRAQAVTVLARLAQAEAAGTGAFTDVAAGSWYGGYVGWATECGIVQGDGKGHFLPDSQVTGAHMELMLTRYAGQAGLDYTASNTSDDPLTRAELAEMLMKLVQA